MENFLKWLVQYLFAFGLAAMDGFVRFWPWVLVGVLLAALIWLLIGDK